MNLLIFRQFEVIFQRQLRNFWVLFKCLLLKYPILALNTPETKSKIFSFSKNLFQKRMLKKLELQKLLDKKNYLEISLSVLTFLFFHLCNYVCFCFQSQYQMLNNYIMALKEDDDLRSPVSPTIAATP